MYTDNDFNCHTQYTHKDNLSITVGLGRCLDNKHLLGRYEFRLLSHPLTDLDINN